jgi:hypothetical protein
MPNSCLVSRRVSTPLVTRPIMAAPVLLPRAHLLPESKRRLNLEELR